jgi:hypothetical protein
MTSGHNCKDIFPPLRFSQQIHNFAGEQIGQHIVDGSEIPVR